MSWLDNGGILGKKLDLNSKESYLISSTGSGSLEFVGAVNAAILGTTTTTSVTLNLTGGIDSRPSANDLVIASYAISLPIATIDPGLFSSNTSTASDAAVAATLALKPISGQSPSYIAGTTQAIVGGNTTSTSVNLPVGTSANDLVIIGYGIGSAVDRRANLTSGMVTQGYTITANITTLDTFDANLGVFFKIMGATPDTTVTIPNTGAVGDGGAVAIQVWRNIDTTTPLDVVTTVSANPNSRLPNPAAISPITKNAAIVIVGSGSYSGTADTFTGPTGYTTDFQSINRDDTSVDVLVGMGYRTALFDPEIDYVNGILSRANGIGSGYTSIANNWAIGAAAGTAGTGVYGSSPLVLSHSVAYKIMGTTPDTTITFPATGDVAYGGAYSVQVWRYANTTSPLDVATVTYTQSNGSSNGATTSTTGTRQPDPQSITPTTTGSIIIATGGVATTGGAAFTNSGLSGFRTNYSDDTSGDAIMGMYYDTWTSGAYDPVAFTVATNSLAGAASSFTLAIKPVSNVPITTIGNKVYSGNWNNAAKFLSKARDVEIAKVVSYTTAYTTAAATSVNIVLPEDIKSDDLILIFAGTRAQQTQPAFDNVTYKPTGYTLIKTSNAGAGDCQFGAFYKISNGTESGTTLNIPQNATSHMSVIAVIVRGTLTSSPIGNIGANVESGSAVTTYNVPGIITSRNRSIVFVTTAIDGSDTLPIILSPTNGWIYGNNSIQVGSSGTTVGVATIVSWKTVETANGSSGYTGFTWSVADGATGFQFEVESVN